MLVGQTLGPVHAAHEEERGKLAAVVPLIKGCLINEPVVFIWEGKAYVLEDRRKPPQLLDFSLFDVLNDIALDLCIRHVYQTRHTISADLLN